MLVRGGLEVENDGRCQVADGAVAGGFRSDGETDIRPQACERRPGDFGRSILKQACMFVEYCANEKLRKVAFLLSDAPRGGPPLGATLFWALGRVRSGVHHHAAGRRAASGAVPTDLTRRG
jgi:hypothetical protein